MTSQVILVLALLTVSSPVPLSAAAAPPPVPASEAECVRAGGQCLASGDCPQWQRPLPGICSPGRDCCFQDYSSHSLSCGQFGGECTSEMSCGNAPQHPNAFCALAGQVCCVWLF